MFTCQHNKIWKQRICRPFHSALMTCCYTLIRGQLDPLEPMYVWKWCHCYHSYLIQDSDAQPCTSKLLWFMMHINNAYTCIPMLPITSINLMQAFFGFGYPLEDSTKCSQDCWYKMKGVQNCHQHSKGSQISTMSDIETPIPHPSTPRSLSQYFS